MKSEVWLLIIAGVLVSSCGLVKRGTIPWEDNYNPPSATLSPETDPAVEMAAPSGNLTRSQRRIRTSLESAYRDWKGIPYMLGGTGRSGIDCSAFMQIVFQDYLDIRLPRTTQEQMSIGKKISRRRIQMGDMVFFQTGRKTLHVGVMINSEQFLHASTSAGVKISELKHQYWADTYKATRRIF